mmetsp:Transcript_88947/g.251017  ORF Transcript_88947/g.251017 Transcript_88947/m.251017 type:complete len:206 (+) Transcript_88947:271-888(+)
MAMTTGRCRGSWTKRSGAASIKPWLVIPTIAARRKASAACPGLRRSRFGAAASKVPAALRQGRHCNSTARMAWTIGSMPGAQTSRPPAARLVPSHVRRPRGPPRRRARHHRCRHPRLRPRRPLCRGRPLRRSRSQPWAWPWRHRRRRRRLRRRRRRQCRPCTTASQETRTGRSSGLESRRHGAASARASHATPSIASPDLASPIR